MWFGVRSLDEAGQLAGATLAHSQQVSGYGKLRKGHILSPADIAALRESGVAEITVAIPDADDMMEDAAAGHIADRFEPDGFRRNDVGTGRVNLHALSDGVLVVDRASIDALNRIDPAITMATLPEYARVDAGQMIATVKIIPFAVGRPLVEKAAAAIAARGTIRVRPFRDGLRVAMIQTRVAGTRASVLDKTRRVTEARLETCHASLTGEARVAHSVPELVACIGDVIAEADLLLLFGASAMTDRRDVIPRSIEQAGGSIVQVGMPVDPGNLLVLGEIGGKPVIGAPGCARSPKENGFDWVLQRLCAGIAVTADDIVSMGVGGLLTEIPLRPYPRETSSRKRSP